MKAFCNQEHPTFGGFAPAADDGQGGKLAERYAGRAAQTDWHTFRFPVRIITKWCAAIRSHMPVGYQDETGFHFGAKAGEWGIFNLMPAALPGLGGTMMGAPGHLDSDSGGQRFFSGVPHPHLLGDCRPHRFQAASKSGCMEFPAG